MLTTYTSYRLVASDLDSALDRTAKAPPASREIDYWNAKIGNVKSIDDFLADARLFTFAMKAHGLGDMAYAKGFMRKLLEGGLSDPASMANRLSDVRYKQFAETFNFERYGPFTMTLGEARNGTVQRYLRQTLEETEGAANEGVRLALYFQRKAADLVSPMQILGDPALLKVVQTAYSLPASMSGASIDAQAAMIADKIDVTTLREPAAMEKLLQRFTALYDIAAGPAKSSPAAMLIDASAGTGVGVDTLMSIARLRTGG
ncbi:MAG: DUF1217 domain-containing protein [Methylobacteriaceae bacterium]|nr:DUF1217 domain-containing protein [Methylobacteriaceae bacterium]